MRLSIFAGVFLFGVSASAQTFSFGLIGGAALTEDFQNNIRQSPPSAAFIAYSTPKRWIAGAAVEVRLPFHLAIEADGLYHELEFTQATVEPNGTLNSVSPAPVVTWEFPILAKYRISIPRVKPFIEAGPTFRTSGNLNGTLPSSHGFAAGLGIGTHLWKLRIEPQFRYLRWARDRYAYLAASTVPDQVEFLAAITFP